MDSSFSAMDSPKPSVRKVFGEITNSFNNLVKTPLKEDQNPNLVKEEEALTPLANLKMLIRVASETEDLPPKRELFRDDSVASIDEDHDYHSTSASSGLTNTLCGLNMCQENVTPSPSSTSSTSLGPPKVSRKQKSLGLLCEKFMARFPESVPDGEKCEIPLDDLAKQMATERRRIYDIVNVLEAVQMMTKVGKNLYQWHGIAHRVPTLAWLRQLAFKLKMLERFNEVKALEESCENFYGSTPEFLSPNNSGCGTPNGINSPFSPSLSPTSSSGGPSPSPIERKTSLGVACQKFLMLFLIAPEKNAKINLDFAARVIHGIALPESVMKTRIRRLYDIANILQSLQLIQKVQVQEASGIKKPAFQYIGPDLDAIDDLSKDAISSLPATRQRNSLLAVGKNLLNIPDEEPEQPCRIIRSTSSSELAKPLKKRLITGFNFDHTVNNQNENENSLKRPASTSLIDLSNACEAVERQKIIRRQSPIRAGSHLNIPNAASLIRISPHRRSHIISPINHHSSGGITLLRKPLSPLTSGMNISRSGNTIKPLSPVTNFTTRKPLSPLTSCLIRNSGSGFHSGNGSRTVIAVMPPTTSNNSIMDLSKRKY